LDVEDGQVKEPKYILRAFDDYNEGIIHFDSLNTLLSIAPPEALKAVEEEYPDKWEESWQSTVETSTGFYFNDEWLAISLEKK